MDPSNPKKSLIMKLFELQKLKKISTDSQNQNDEDIEDVKPDIVDIETQSLGTRTTLADSE